MTDSTIRAGLAAKAAAERQSRAVERMRLGVSVALTSKVTVRYSIRCATKGCYLSAGHDGEHRLLA